MNWLDWYNLLAKPTRTPAAATIGLFWQVLYLIILVTFGFVFVHAFPSLEVRGSTLDPFQQNLALRCPNVDTASHGMASKGCLWLLAP
jgi:hypothetical protein